MVSDARSVRGDASCLAFELFNPLQGFTFEIRGGPRDGNLSHAFDAWDSPVERRNQLVQFANGPRSIELLGCRALDHARLACVIRRAGFQISPQREQRQ